MMRTSHLRAVGGSVMLAIPENVLDRLQLRAHTKVGLTISDGKLLIDPDPKPRYTLDELVAKCEPDAPLSRDDREWLRSSPVGRETF